VSISLQSTNGGDDLYYTLDGSLPNTSSFPYAGPFNLTSNATVRANAFRPVSRTALPQRPSSPCACRFQFDSGGFFTNNTFQMPVSGLAGKTYYLQATTNFTDWTTLSTNIANSNSFYLVDPDATNFTYRFYRAIELLKLS